MPLNSQKLSLSLTRFQNQIQILSGYILLTQHNNPILLKELPQKINILLQYFYYKYSIVHKFNFVKSFLNKFFPNKKPPLSRGLKFKSELKNRLTSVLFN